MASRQGGPSSSILGEARDAGDAPDAEPETRYMSNEGPGSNLVPCRWRTSEFYDQECYRYFDCPSHLVERRLSLDESREPGAPGESVSAEPETHENDTPAGESIDRIQMLDQDHGASDARDNTMATESPPRPSAALHGNVSAGQSSFDLLPFPLRTSSLAGRRRSADLRPSVDNNGTRLWNHPLERDDRTPMASALPADVGSSSPRGPPRGPANTMFSISGGRTAGEGSSRQSSAELPENEQNEPTEVVLPRWQPDAEVTYCPICNTQFSIFVRKHHCRKCGRVVCNSCSPHRIIIPHQFIVRLPGSEVPLPQSLLIEGPGAGYVDVNRLSGGERVRLCNPCVPDPNTAPPQTPTSPSGLSPRSARRRSRSSLGGGYPTASPTANRYEGVFTTGQSNDPYQFYTSRSRSITMDPTSPIRAGSGPSSRRRSSATYQSSLNQLVAVGPSGMSPAAVHHNSRRRVTGDAGSSSRQRALPPPPQIAEEDECPICHLELPSRDLPNHEALRESHITSCIQSHSAYGSPRTGSGGNTPQAAPRRTGMYTYPATEKDCIDDAECTICLEEFTVGVPMARLECLCRFHRGCIVAWFVNHPGRCPVHQHDGFGY